MWLSNITEIVNITKDMNAIMIDEERKLLTKNPIPYHWPRNNIANGIAQSAKLPVALTYTVTTATNSVIHQNIEQ